MQLLYSIPVVLILTCLPLSATVKVREEQIKGENGMLYDVTVVMDDNTNVVIIKKDGAIVEEQISKRGKNYDVIKTNEACNIQFIEKSPKDCYEATVPDKVPKDIMDECGDDMVLYVKSTNCAKDDDIQKKSCFYRYYYYHKYVCTHYYWGRRYCHLKRYSVRRCYYQG